MNKDQLMGSLKIALAGLNQYLAAVTGDQERLRQAQQLQLEGKVQHTMGKARSLIKRSLKQHMST